MEILPYAYSFLVFAIVAFLFIVLWRVLNNVETKYSATHHVIQKNSATHVNEIIESINQRGNDGWKLEQIIDNAMTTTLIYTKSTTKLKFF